MTEQEALKYLIEANRNNQMLCVLRQSDIAPTKMHMISSVILLMPALRRLLQEEKND